MVSIVIISFLIDYKNLLTFILVVTNKITNLKTIHYSQTHLYQSREISNGHVDYSEPVIAHREAKMQEKRIRLKLNPTGGASPFLENHFREILKNLLQAIWKKDMSKEEDTGSIKRKFW